MNDAARFIGKDGLHVRSLVDAVLDSGPIRSGLGGRLWRWANGVYLSDGTEEVYRRTRVLLGERWRKNHADNVVAWLAADEPFIGDDEPVDRLNCLSGLVDYRTGELLPHNPDRPTTYQVPHRWNPDATCPTVDAWLGEVFPPDAQDFAWELLAYLLHPANPFHRAILLYGTGRNGKGTFLRLATALIGRAYVSNQTLQALGEDRFAAASLYRKVANVAGDLDARMLKRTDVFKMATGGDRISAQQKYGQPFEFDATATFLFAANELPGTADVTEGFFSRWLVVPFTGHFPDGIADRTLEQRLHTELEGVFQRAASTLGPLLDRGAFAVPTSVTSATVDYRSKADPVRQFLDECLDINPDARARRTDTHTTYTRWCEDAGHRPLARRRFFDRLRAVAPISDCRIGGYDYFAGIGILEDRERL